MSLEAWNHVEYQNVCCNMIGPHFVEQALGHLIEGEGIFMLVVSSDGNFSSNLLPVMCECLHLVKYAKPYDITFLATSIAATFGIDTAAKFCPKPNEIKALLEVVNW